MKPRSSLRRAAVAAIGLGVVALASAASGCRDNLDEKVTNKCPSQEVFEQSVSPFLERRCGTLDCHGSAARPMRIFGQLGLRRVDEGNVSGGALTTPGELRSNYASVCNVDAERMSESVDDFGNQAETLLLVTKARGFENHKGGKVVSENDAGDRCLRGWLRGEDVTEACQDAVDQIQ